MGDFFTSYDAAEEFVAGLNRVHVRAVVAPPHDGRWRVASPDLDFRREDRVWDSAEAALDARLQRA